MAAKHSYLVTLPTGRQGASTAVELLKHGKIVRALVDDKTSSRAKALEVLGCILFEGTLDDKSTIEPAMKGVTGIFLNLRPAHQDAEAEVRQTNNVLEVATSTNTVTSIVVSTALKTGKHEEYLSHGHNYPVATFYQSKKGVEDAVRASHIRYKTFLRPGWLMHNYLEPLWRLHYPSTYQSEHLLEVTYPPGTTAAHFDPADVGKFAAVAFLDPEKFNGHEIELGNEQLTIEEVARTIENASGAKMRTKHLVDDDDLERAKTIYSYGLWQWSLKEGHFLTNPRDLDQYQIRLTTFDEFCRREANSLKEALQAVKK
jgi:uncharacterized protein YbjT (DUF2867 family)